MSINIYSVIYKIQSYGVRWIVAVVSVTTTIFLTNLGTHAMID